MFQYRLFLFHCTLKSGWMTQFDENGERGGNYGVYAPHTGVIYTCVTSLSSFRSR